MGQKDLLWRTAAVVLAMVISTAGDAEESAETCSSCAECEGKLASGSYSVVVLDADIEDHPGTCIDLHLGESNLTFDCAGHRIDGDGIREEPALGDPARAVALMQGSGNTVRNCTISDFDAAFYLVNGSGLVLENNHLVGNRVGVDLSNGHSNTISGNIVQGGEMGIKITNSDNNTVVSNTVCCNIPWDFYHESGVGNSGLDNTCDLTSGWNDLGVIGCTFGCAIFTCGFESGDLVEWSGSAG